MLSTACAARPSPNAPGRPDCGEPILRAANGQGTHHLLVQRWGMAIAERIAAGLTKAYDRTRSKKAVDAASADPTGSINDLKGKKYCLLITYKSEAQSLPPPLLLRLRMP